MNRLKELRQQRNKTQQELADFLNLTPKAISFYELGQRDIPNNILLKLADYFHVPTDYILGRKSTSDNKPSPIKQMLDLYHHLTPEKKKQARSYIAFLAQDNNIV